LKNKVINIEKLRARLIGVEGLSIYLDIPVNTLRCWVWQRQIPFYKIGRLVKFDIKEIDTWLEERKENVVN